LAFFKVVALESLIFFLFFYFAFPEVGNVMKNFFIWLAKSERWAVGGGRCRSWVGFIRILFYPLTFVLSGLAIKANNTK